MMGLNPSIGIFINEHRVYAMQKTSVKPQRAARARDLAGNHQLNV